MCVCVKDKEMEKEWVQHRAEKEKRGEPGRRETQFFGRRDLKCKR